MSSAYYVTHNSLGDIVGLYTGSGVLVAAYTYDSWGNVLSIKDASGASITNASHIGNLNPFRYRGYYMDTETGLYYLMSRYYDPVTCRFVNADGYFQTGQGFLDKNMSAYCMNNPIMFIDVTGHWAVSVGPSINATLFWGVSIGINVAFDSYGNVGIQWTHMGTSTDNPYFGLADIGAGLTTTILWDEDVTIYDFEKETFTAGASGGPSWYVGADAVIIPEYSMVPSGISVTGGIGIGVDAHVTQPSTSTIWSNNPKPNNSNGKKGTSPPKKSPPKSCSGCGKPIGTGPGYCGGW